MSTPSSSPSPSTPRAAVDTVSAGAPPEKVGPWLAEHLADPRWAECSLAPIGDGRSNLTYLVRSPAGAVVLRRPPLGSVAATAHDMGREQRVLRGLAGTDVPVPAVLGGETEPDLLGAPFYVMEMVDGVVPPGPDDGSWAGTEAQRREAGLALVDVLARLHQVVPAEVGLGEFGRPAGFMARQVRRWSTQWETWQDGFAAAELAAAGGDGTTGEPGRPELTRLAGRLREQVPDSPEVAVVHGDFRMENCLFEGTRVRAVLDWEMSTLGDPLADLGLLLVYWHQAQEHPAWAAAQYLPSATARPGFPTRAEVVQRYAEQRGLDPAVVAGQVPFYVAFGAFKLAVVLAGVVARANAGAADARTGRGLLGALDPLVSLGHLVLDEGLR